MKKNTFASIHVARRASRRCLQGVLGGAPRGDILYERRSTRRRRPRTSAGAVLEARPPARAGGGRAPWRCNRSVPWRTRSSTSSGRALAAATHSDGPPAHSTPCRTERQTTPRRWRRTLLLAVELVLAQNAFGGLDQLCVGELRLLLQLARSAPTLTVLDNSQQSWTRSALQPPKPCGRTLSTAALYLAWSASIVCSGFESNMVLSELPNDLNRDALPAVGSGWPASWARRSPADRIARAARQRAAGGSTRFDVRAAGYPRLDGAEVVALGGERLHHALGCFQAGVVVLEHRLDRRGKQLVLVQRLQQDRLRLGELGVRPLQRGGLHVSRRAPPTVRCPAAAAGRTKKRVLKNTASAASPIRASGPAKPGSDWENACIVAPSSA